MFWWIVVGVVVVACFAVAWWRSGRMKPVTHQIGSSPDTGLDKSQIAGFRNHVGGGPAGGVSPS